MTDRNKNITLPQTSFTSGNKAIIFIITQITMTNTLNQDQTFPITEQPVADSVTITVLGVYSTTNNGFKEIYFDGKEGKGFFLQ